MFSTTVVLVVLGALVELVVLVVLGALEELVVLVNLLVQSSSSGYFGLRVPIPVVLLVKDTFSRGPICLKSPTGLKISATSFYFRTLIFPMSSSSFRNYPALCYINCTGRGPDNEFTEESHYSVLQVRCREEQTTPAWERIPEHRPNQSQ